MAVPRRVPPRRKSSPKSGTARSVKSSRLKSQKIDGNQIHSGPAPTPIKKAQPRTGTRKLGSIQPRKGTVKIGSLMPVRSSTSRLGATQAQKRKKTKRKGAR